MNDTPPFDPPYKTLVKTATGAIVTETLADGSKRELGEVALNTGQVSPAPSSPTIKSSRKPATHSASANDKAATYLNVPFADKEKAKAKGAKWDATKKKWYAPHGVDIHFFKPWWPDALK